MLPEKSAWSEEKKLVADDKSLHGDQHGICSISWLFLDACVA